MTLPKNIIHYLGYCLLILAALSSGVSFGSSPSLKQTVHYHYFLSPEGSEYPIYLHIESPDGPDPLTMKSGLFDQDMADDMSGLSLVWHKSPALSPSLTPRFLRLCLNNHRAGREPEYRELELPAPGKPASFADIGGNIDARCSRIGFAGLEMPLRPASEAEALPAQPGHSGYTIWLVERQKRELNTQESSFSIPVFTRQGGKPCLLMNGDSICGGGQDDIDHKKRKPPMGMGGEFPSDENLDYEVYSGQAWLNHFASTLMSWQQETVENDDVIIRIIDPDNGQIGLRHINQEDWQSMTRAMHPGISDEDLEKLVRWSQRATVTIQVKNMEVLSGAHNAGSGGTPGMISFEDDGGLAAQPLSFTGGGGTTRKAGGGSHLYPTLSGMHSGGSGGDDGGDDGDQTRNQCPICHHFFTPAQLSDHLKLHLADQIRTMTEALPMSSQPTHPVTPTGKSSGSRTRLFTDEERQRRLESVRAKQQKTSAAVSPPVMGGAQLQESIEAAITHAAFDGAVGLLASLPLQQWRDISMGLGRLIAGNGLMTYREYLRLATLTPDAALPEIRKSLLTKNYQGNTIDIKLANRLILGALINAAKEAGLQPVAQRIISQAKSYPITMDMPEADADRLLDSCKTLMENHFFEQTDLENVQLVQPLVVLLTHLASDIPDDTHMALAINILDRRSLGFGDIGRSGSLRDLIEQYAKLCELVISQNLFDAGADLLFNMMRRSGAWKNEPNLLPALSSALKIVWDGAETSGNSDLTEPLAHLAIYLLNHNFLVQDSTASLTTLSAPQVMSASASADATVDTLDGKPKLVDLISSPAIQGLTDQNKITIFLLKVGLSYDDTQMFVNEFNYKISALNYWLKHDPSPSWRKVIQALHGIKKSAEAQALEASLLPSLLPRITMNSILAEGHLSEIYQDVLSAQNHTQFLFLRLNILTRDIEAISTQYPAPKDRLLQGLKLWINKGGATIKKLAIGLRSSMVNLPRVAEHLESKYGSR